MHFKAVVIFGVVHLFRLLALHLFSTNAYQDRGLGMDTLISPLKKFISFKRVFAPS